MFPSYPSGAHQVKSAFCWKWEPLLEAQVRPASLPRGSWECLQWGHSGRSCVSVSFRRTVAGVVAVGVGLCPGQAGWQSISSASKCGSLPSCCCLNCVFPRPGLPKLSPAVTSCQPVVSTLFLSLPRDNSIFSPADSRTAVLWA